MPVTATITIPLPVLPTSPAGTFGVVVKNSAGTIVFTGTETNAPFNVAGLPAGDYVCYTTYNGNTDGWCFTVIDCTCPILPMGVITSSGAGTAIVYFLELTFDMSGGFPNCPFFIAWDDGVVSSEILISSLADFTSNVGSFYKKKIHLYSSHVGYIIEAQSRIGCTAGQVNLVYACHPPTMPTVSEVKIGSDYYLRAVFPDCGVSCHDITISWWQNYVVPLNTPDAGSQTITLDCLAPYPLTIDILLSPAPTFYSSYPSRVAYFYSVDDCCGTRIYSAIG